MTLSQVVTARLSLRPTDSPKDGKGPPKSALRRRRSVDTSSMGGKREAVQLSRKSSTGQITKANLRRSHKNHDLLTQPGSEGVKLNRKVSRSPSQTFIFAANLTQPQPQPSIGR